MKYCYIIFDTIYSIGGSQKHTKAEYDYLKDKGYEVFILSHYKSKLFIEEFMQFEKLYFSFLAFNPFIFSKKQQNKLIQKILNEIEFSKYEKIYIESHSVVFSLWGELLAKKLNAKHFVHNLSESLEITEPEFSFLNFKHERKELAGIVPDSIQRLFKYYKQVPEEESYCLKAVSDYPIQPIVYKNKFKNNSDFKIGTIGRIDKDFVLKISKEINQFALLHPEKLFSYMIIGGCAQNEKKIIRSIKQNCYAPNLTCFITGRMYPIPTEIVDSCDLFISTSGSARISAQYGKLTIAVDTFSGFPIGIYPIETADLIYSDFSSKKLIEYLDEIFFINGIDNDIYKFDVNAIQFSKENYLNQLTRKFNFILRNNISTSYYQFEDNFLIRRNDRIKKILVKFLGIKFFFCLFDAYKKLIS